MFHVEEGKRCPEISRQRKIALARYQVCGDLAWLLLGGNCCDLRVAFCLGKQRHRRAAVNRHPCHRGSSRTNSSTLFRLVMTSIIKIVTYFHDLESFYFACVLNMGTKTQIDKGATFVNGAALGR